MSQLLGFAGLTTGLSALVSLCSIGFSICTMLAIGFDCKAKNVKSRTAYMVLAFFFPVITAIVYLCKRSQYAIEAAEQQIDDTQGNAKSSKTCTILAIIFCVAVVVSTIVTSVITVKMVTQMNFDDDSNIYYGYDLDGETVYYDMNGVAYSSSIDVPYYDKDGNAYTYSVTGDYTEVLTDKDGNSYDFYDAYVDSNGYLFFDFDYNVQVDDDWNYVDENGNICYDAGNVSWDAAGNMFETPYEDLYEDLDDELSDFNFDF